MDRSLRETMRAFWCGRLEEEAALRALERAGATRRTRWAMVNEALHRAFIDLLDYRSLEAAEPTWNVVVFHPVYGPEAPFGPKLRPVAIETEVEALPREEEDRLARDASCVWRARRPGGTTSVLAWFPSRHEMLAEGHGDPRDVRLVVSAPFKERAEVMETLLTEMPWASIVSQQVGEARPPRMLVQQPKEEAEWPAESTRVHVR